MANLSRPQFEVLNFVREFHPGMGQAVAERTVLRRKEDGEWESWGDVAHRVALGNSLLANTEEEQREEFKTLRKHLAKATLLMSGRHLQHGDENQPTRNMEVFTNCFHGETKVLTLEYGPVAMQDIVGKEVTVRSADGEFRKAKCSSHGKQKLYLYEFGGKTAHLNKEPVISVKATKNHRWFLEDGSVTTNLSLNDTLAPQKYSVVEDLEAIRHGLIFGDGSAHKSRLDYQRHYVSQGRSYCAIRLCGNDKNYLSYFEDYPVSYPKSAAGDPVVYLGKKPFWKELPFTTDPDYIAGFIKGWWLADGLKTYPREKFNVISTTNELAVEWMKEYASYAGYIITRIGKQERKPGDGSYANGKALYEICFAKAEDKLRKVRRITELEETEVFCLEEPVTSGFVLANGLLTGNCATASASFLLFYLLLNGAGVGRCYDDELMLVNWDNAPIVRCVLDQNHPDFDWSAHESVRDAEHKYGAGKDTLWFKVPDSREGWATALEIWENAAFEKIHRDKMLILDFSDVRPSGSPIGGMQNRPASGPVALMNAFQKACTLKGAKLEPWRQAMYIDHYFAECVLVGGARRAARMSTKLWSDENVCDFVTVKRPIEFLGKSVSDIVGYREDATSNGKLPPMGFLWSSNNSVTVDAEFWRLVGLKRTEEEFQTPIAKHARKVFKLVTEASYADGTGEPGFINVDRLVRNDEGWDEFKSGDYVGSKKFQIREQTELFLSKLARRAKKMKYNMITNPCGEIALTVNGGFCVIADVVPYHADSLDEAEDAFRAATRALIRVNTMDSIYNKEVARTNRIGVGMTGVHEFAWKFFKLGFKDLIDEEKSKDFWLTMSRFNRAVNDEAVKYSAKLGLNVPHTMTTIKPAGTTSKLFGLTEGWHLPAMAWYMRWVQFRHDDPLVEEYKKAGYPHQELTQYSGTVVIGFPTEPVIASLEMGDKLITAGDATPEEQYKWLMLGEKYWIQGTDENGVLSEENRGNQISYTLKYKPDLVDYRHFKTMMQKYQSQVRACSVMPQIDASAYEYQPEQSVTKAEYEAFAHAIEKAMAEDIGRDHIDCGSGGCPIDFDEDMEKEVISN